MDFFRKKFPPKYLAELLNLVEVGTILLPAARDLFAEKWDSGQSPATVVAQQGLATVPTDANELEQWCRDSIAANAKALAEFKAGKDSAINAFKGPVMKAAKGKANPKLVDETLRRLLAAL
jgi:aspartyl-tRNA(Asn)/glutamyl-tRNA(Gln) amidotransferase subunit B